MFLCTLTRVCMYIACGYTGAAGVVSLDVQNKKKKKDNGVKPLYPNGEKNKT